MECSDPRAKEAVVSGMRVEATGRYRPRGQGDNRRVFTAFNLLTSGGPRPQATMRVPSESVRGVCLHCSWWVPELSCAIAAMSAILALPKGTASLPAPATRRPPAHTRLPLLRPPTLHPLPLSAAYLQSRHVQAWSAPLQSAQMPCPPSLSMP